jgi:uncharacterized RDD family membrane protein YckC
MDKIKIPTSFNIELEFETPEFHKRLFAWLADLFFLFAYIMLVRSLLQRLPLAQSADLSSAYDLSFLGLIAYSPVLVYHLVCELVLNGQSLGKKMMGLKVISETGNRPALHQFLIRWLLRPVDFTFSLGLGGLLSVLLSKKNQRLGDMAAGTIVIKTRQRTDLNETVFFELEEDYRVRYPAVMQLSDRDMNLIKNIIDNCRRSNNASMAGPLAEKIRTVLQINEYQENLDFLETLLKDYNYLSNR